MFSTFYLYFGHPFYIFICLQCFDAVGWVAGRASGLWKLSGEVLAWLSVWSELQMICIWSSWCHCHPIISCSSSSSSSSSCSSCGSSYSCSCSSSITYFLGTVWTFYDLGCFPITPQCCDTVGWQENSPHKFLSYEASGSWTNFGNSWADCYGHPIQ